jgi:hypothetical protein
VRENRGISLAVLVKQICEQKIEKKNEKALEFLVFFLQVHEH